LVVFLLECVRFAPTGAYISKICLCGVLELRKVELTKGAVEGATTGTGTGGEAVTEECCRKI